MGFGITAINMGKNHNYNQIGKDIEAAVKDGISSGDWSRIGNVISNSVDTVLDDVGDRINKFSNDVVTNGVTKNLSSYQAKYTDGTYTQERIDRLNAERKSRMEAERKHRAELEKQKQRKEEQAKANRAKRAITNVPMVRVGNVSSTLYTVAGGIGLGITGATMLAALPRILLGNMSYFGLAVGVVFLLGFSRMLGKGISGSNRLKFAERCAQLCGDKGYIEIDNLARALGQKPRKVIKDIKRILQMGFFPQGRLDDDEKNLIFTDKVYSQYIESKRNRAIQEQEAVDTTARVVDDSTIVEGLTPEESIELKQMIAEGESYIQKLRELNQKIPGEVITAKLTRLEGLLTEIFTRVKEHPEQMGKMHELMDYYLPTMLKLVTAYEEYDKVSEPGEDIINAKADIESTLDTINSAFRKLLNNLFKDSVWDVTTDAQVLKTVLAQKGLSNGMEGDN